MAAKEAKLLSFQLSRLFDVSGRSYESAALTAELRALRHAQIIKDLR